MADRQQAGAPIAPAPVMGAPYGRGRQQPYAGRGYADWKASQQGVHYNSPGVAPVVDAYAGSGANGIASLGNPVAGETPYGPQAPLAPNILPQPQVAPGPVLQQPIVPEMPAAATPQQIVQSAGRRIIPR